VTAQTDPWDDYLRATPPLIDLARYCRDFDTSLKLAYEQLRDGEITAVRDGRRTKIETASAVARVKRLPRYQPELPPGLVTAMLNKAERKARKVERAESI
jgi:hypothetical protein